ncbi:MAG: hypothetical protein HQK76_16825 [Desulfobacterales bacterium]|nr:hypothetical protein [Desulfobacterales bacterium]
MFYGTVTTIAYVLYKLKGSPLQWDETTKTLSGIKQNIGAPRGYSIVDDLKKWNIPVEESPSTYNDFQKLLKDRLDGVAALELAGDFYLKKDSKFNDIEKVSPPLLPNLIT